MHFPTLVTTRGKKYHWHVKLWPWKAEPLFQDLGNHVRGCHSDTQLCPTVCDPMDCSTPDFPVLHYLLEFAQIHVHWVDDAIQASQTLLPPFPAFCHQDQGTVCYLGLALVFYCFFFFYIKEPLFVYLFLAGSWFSCMGILAVSRGYSLAAARGLLVVASLVSERRL